MELIQRHSNIQIDKNILDDILDKTRQIPAFKTLRVTIESLSVGECVARVPRNRDYDGIFESYHGGMLMTAADTIASVALMTESGTDFIFATTDMNIRLLNKCVTDVFAHAKVIKHGRTLSYVHVDLIDEQNQLVAVAQVNYIKMKKNN